MFSSLLLGLALPLGHALPAGPAEIEEVDGVLPRNLSPLAPLLDIEPVGFTESSILTVPGLPPLPAPAPPPPAPPRKPSVPPTYPNTPTPFGDFTGPAFGPSEPDRFPLMKWLQGTLLGDLLDSSRTQFTGWVDMSYNVSSAHRDNLPMGFDSRANDFVVQQNYFRLDRSVDTGRKEFDFGYRFDWIAPGIDARYTVARGLLDSTTDPTKRRYGFDPLQFYFDLWFPEIGQGTTVRLGRFLDIGGVETIPSVANILVSHSYTYIYTPFTQTGAYATTRLTDQWYVIYGLVLGNDVFIDPTDEVMFIGVVKWVSLSKTDSLYATTYVNGGNYFGPRQRDNVQYFDLIYTHVWTMNFQTIHEMLFAFQRSVPGLDTVTWYGLNTFFQYDFTPRLYGAIRPEVWEDSEGQRTGFKGLYADVTIGLTWKPTTWLFIRPEIRFDHNFGADGPYEGKHDLFTVAQDVVLRW